jgi:hypothetical protein
VGFISALLSWPNANRALSARAIAPSPCPFSESSKARSTIGAFGVADVAALDDPVRRGDLTCQLA